MSSTQARHAFLIMAHNRPDLLQPLLHALDDARNDIYVHVDAKAASDMDPVNFSVKNARMQFIERMEVNWGGYSQIECSFRLLNAALADGEHAYYHLLTGATYPLVSQDEFHAFFQEHTGYEFVDFVLAQPPYERVRFIRLFNEDELTRGTRRDSLIKRRTRSIFTRLQQLFGYDHFKQFNLKYQKGLAYWSITQDFAQYVCEHEKLLHNMLKYTTCGDEVFVQTLVWNSPFQEHLYKQDGRFECMRVSTWPLEDSGLERPGHDFQLDDLDYLLTSGCLFALKFSGPDGLELIQKIDEHIATRV